MCGEGCNRIPIHTLLCCLLLPADWLWTYSHSEMPWLYIEVMPFSLWAKDDRGPELKVRRQRHRRNSSTFPSSITSLVLLFSFEHHSNYQQLTGVCDCALPLSWALIFVIHSYIHQNRDIPITIPFFRCSNQGSRSLSGLLRGTS